MEEWPEVQERSSTPITWASSFYYKDNVQIGVALLIFLNFVQNAIESQVCSNFWDAVPEIGVV